MYLNKIYEWILDIEVMQCSDLHGILAAYFFVLLVIFFPEKDLFLFLIMNSSLFRDFWCNLINHSNNICYFDVCQFFVSIYWKYVSHLVASFIIDLPIVFQKKCGVEYLSRKLFLAFDWTIFVWNQPIRTLMLLLAIKSRKSGLK